MKNTHNYFFGLLLALAMIPVSAARKVQFAEVPETEVVEDTAADVAFDPSTTIAAEAPVDEKKEAPADVKADAPVTAEDFDALKDLDLEGLFGDNPEMAAMFKEQMEVFEKMTDEEREAELAKAQESFKAFEQMMAENPEMADMDLFGDQEQKA